jgi:hypothetical protein
MPYSTFSIRGIDILRTTSRPAAEPARNGTDTNPLVVSVVSANGAWRANITVHRHEDRARIPAAAACGPVRCIVGDSKEVAGEIDGPYVNATVVDLDCPASETQSWTSLTGLPPVFIFRSGSATSLSCPFLPEAARGFLEPDPDGVADFLRWGHPIDGRTLFLNLSAVASNARVTVTATGDVKVERL